MYKENVSYIPFATASNVTRSGIVLATVIDAIISLPNQ